MKRRTRILSTLLALVLGATACGSSADPQASVDLDPDDVILTSGLRTVESCDALLEQFKEIGVDKVGPWGFGQGGPIMMLDDGMLREESMAVEAMDDSAGAVPKFNDVSGTVGAEESGGGFSGTNNQEANVDEADLVKTDGRRLVAVFSGYANVFDVSGEMPRLTSRIKLPENVYDGEIFLNGDTALLMATGWTGVPLARSIDSSSFQGTETARLIELDLASGTVGNIAEFDGRYISARQIDDTVRVALTSSPANFPFVYPSNTGAEDAALKANQDLIRNSNIEDWLPHFRVTSNGETITDGRSVNCDQVYMPAQYSGMSTVSVLTLDIDGGITGETVGTDASVAVVSDGQTVYSSTDRMTIATARWPEFDGNGQAIQEDDYSTVLHNFDISEPGKTEYVASGEVPGSLLSQYSLSEKDGHMRVATTDGAQWWTTEDSESSVYVLAEDGNQLKIVGQANGLGKGERIFSVRFMGDRAYVVTFRQTDPLYVVDLSDPTNPQITGELKIPGYSAYLHPVDENTLIGVGQDGTEDGNTTGTAVSLFDVSDPANPTRTDLVNLGNNSYSNIEWDPKAFTYWADTNSAFVPISWWNYDEQTGNEDNGSASVVIEVGDQSLTEIGRLAHPGSKQCDPQVQYSEEEFEGDVPVEESGDAESALVEGSEDVAPKPTEVAPPEEEYCWDYQPEVRRTVVFEDKIFTISDGGLLISSLEDLSELGWVSYNN